MILEYVHNKKGIFLFNTSDPFLNTTFNVPPLTFHPKMYPRQYLDLAPPTRPLVLLREQIFIKAAKPV